MNQEKPNPRRRYSPEVRRSMILDNTAKIINAEGISNLSMERISRNSDISKSLIYKYFDSLTDLLKELLERELKSLWRLQVAAAQSANTFEELVRNITHEYITYIDQRGMIIQRLQAEPNVSDMTNPTYFGRSTSVDYLASIVSKHFDLPMEIARAVTDISFGLPASAGEYLLRGELSRDEIEELTVSMIIGTITNARDDYLTRTRKLVR